MRDSVAQVRLRPSSCSINTHLRPSSCSLIANPGLDSSLGFKSHQTLSELCVFIPEAVPPALTLCLLLIDALL
jgi:hypothetical protein